MNTDQQKIGLGSLLGLMGVVFLAFSKKRGRNLKLKDDCNYIPLRLAESSPEKKVELLEVQR